ncbi:hypothetical protein NUW58_g4979 [Xylaria curta]|uniref:Uncharacterized protein n=1 Tax=Xylaria curta TaxID=42375 RepID=A0ACC1P3W4_9PEZI|nr:hypothetical protein NUW58_g4979 [Xylaria curta]
MPPRLSAQLRPYARHGAIFKGYTRPGRQSPCFFCSLSSGFNRGGPAQRSNKRAPLGRAQRFETTIATTPIDAKVDPRKELESILLNLQKHGANYVNLSRLQLALNGLRQKPGDESIRVAILGLIDKSTPTNTVKDVLKLLLADPLKDPEAWEQEIEQHDLAEPVIIRIGTATRGMEPAVSLTKGNLLREIHVSSAALDGHNLEILVANTNPFPPASDESALHRAEERVLVPTVDIPTSNTGRYSPITTPVHKALVVADGIHGAASVISMPTSEYPGVLKYAVNIPDYKPTEASPLPFISVDTGIARIGLGLVRKNIANGIEFERLWFQSNIPKLVEWLKADILTTPDDATKPPVRELIASLLRNASASIQAEENRLIKLTMSSAETQRSSKTIESGLSEWAESAHSELQEQLDIAFSSTRWRKLGWWKLFWRVDDVGMLTNDILTQKFLPEAERSSIFLAGRMKEAGINLLEPRPYKTAVAGTQLSKIVTNEALRPQPHWPTNVPDTRNYLQTETVPALQALAQKLVLQTLSTSGLMTALGALAYIGTLTTTLYEAGAVAALGIVWSMRRMQQQWETARDFWEGEVREEGRKAVRGVEETITSALVNGRNQGRDRGAADAQDNLMKAKDLVTKAKRLLEVLK